MNGTQLHQQKRPKAKRQSVFAAAILGICIFSILEYDSYLPSSGGDRRSLLSDLYLQVSHSTLLPWAHHHLVDIRQKPEPESSEVGMFWHIPKAGGTTAKRLYMCMGKTLTIRVGVNPVFGHHEDDELVVFEPEKGRDWKTVNVDTTMRPGIIRAREMGLVQSKVTDLIFTMEPNFASQELFDEVNKGRILALFRHPIDRVVSKFYYLQTATWEKTYRPESANMTMMEYAQIPNEDDNFMVRKLAGKAYGEIVDEKDLILAKELLRQRVVVGLMNEMEESFRRFNIALGVDETTERNKECMNEFFGDNEKKDDANDKVVMKNSNTHPKVVENTPEWDALVAKNHLDMVLYAYAVKLFKEQKDIIDSYTSTIEAVEQLEDIPVVRSNSELITIPTKVRNNLVDFNSNVHHKGDISFFWHVPKSGGTTLQRMLWCMGMTLANEVGGNPKFHPAGRNDVVSFKPWDNNPGRVVNVDVSTLKGIISAKSKGFLSNEDDPSKVDVVSTSEFRFAAEILFSPVHKARMFALFRHPVERAVSKFYYLQKATWEPTYNAKWKKMSLEEWSKKDRGENNWLVRQLVMKNGKDPINENDLELAKEIIRTKFLVGLMDKFDESVRRFNLFLGINTDDPQNKQCISQFTNSDSKSVQVKGKKNEQNSYSHPEAAPGSPAWNNIAKINYFDIELFRFIVRQFHDQKAFFQVASVQ